ncbi:T9SS type A sorting domain-containing protein [Spirosoma telluris]
MPTPVRHRYRCRSSNPGLTIATVTATPTCYDNCDGRITITPTGGTAPYGVTWQNPVSQSLSLTGLCSGSYTVAVTDANGCTVTQTTSLTRPVQKLIVLRANTFICKGQVVDLDGTITDGVTYVWTYPDGSTRTTAMVSVTAAGRYQVVATDKNGCVATAQITLTASDTPAPTLAFAVGSKVGIGEPLIAVNLTNPRPAQSSWTAPPGAQVVSSTEDQLVVTFNQLGTYPITLNGQQGQCAFAITKSVTVVAEPQLTTSVQTTPFIQELTILPNPSSGEFKVRITLSGVSDVKIKVKPLLSTGVDIYQQSATGQNVYELSVNIPNLQTGVYLLTLETAKAIQSTKLLIAR